MSPEVVSLLESWGAQLWTLLGVVVGAAIGTFGTLKVTRMGIAEARKTRREEKLGALYAEVLNQLEALDTHRVLGEISKAHIEHMGNGGSDEAHEVPETYRL